MRRNMVMLGMIAAAALTVSGCQSGKYEKVKIPETQAVSDESVGEAADGQADGQAAGGQEAAGTAAGSAADMPAAESSSVEAEITTETAPAMENRDETVYVNATDLNIRTAPQQGAEVVAVLNTGAELKRTGYSDSWSRVMYQDKECYVATRYLTSAKPAVPETTAGASDAAGTEGASAGERELIGLNPDWKYAGFAKIHSGQAVLYRASSNRKNKVVCVNAGHGTKGGSSVKTQCHPDGTPKVTGGTTGAGATTAVAVSGGMQFSDGTAEAKVTLAMAKVLKEKLLARGYDVLMIRESDDVQLDNVARTVIANNRADCHIALHWDSTTSNKGAFYMSVPNVSSYRSMEPVASHWQEHHALGDSLVAGLKGAGVKIFSSGKMEMDLTQTSYSTVPSIDIELGDKASDHSAATLDNLGTGLADGVDRFFGN